MQPDRRLQQGLRDAELWSPCFGQEQLAFQISQRAAAISGDHGAHQLAAFGVEAQRGVSVDALEGKRLVLDRGRGRGDGPLLAPTLHDA